MTVVVYLIQNSADRHYKRLLPSLNVNLFAFHFIFLFVKGQRIYRAVFKSRPPDRNELFQPGRTVSSSSFNLYSW